MSDLYTNLDGILIRIQPTGKNGPDQSFLKKTGHETLSS